MYNDIISDSIEGMILRGLITLISIGVFIFWRKRKALLNFQAWALLTAIINAILFANQYRICFCGVSIDMTTIRSLYFIEFLTTLVIMFKLWKISEKYMPNETKQIKAEPKAKRKHFHIKLLALWHTIKNGGNHVQDDKKIKKELKAISTR
jgi:hypothetical protein